MEVFQDVEYVQLQSPVHGTYVHAAEDGCSVCLDARRGGYQSAMEVFQDVEYVQLQSPVHGTYVHAAEDGCSVRLDASRASHNAVWAVQRHHSTDSDTGYILFRGAYGRYLGAPDTLSSCSFPCPRVAAAQRDFDEPDIKAITWRAVATSGSAVLLESASGRFLRTGVCLSTYRSSFTASQWIVHCVPWSLVGRPNPPLLPDPHSKGTELLARVCPPLSRVYQRLCSLEREIQWVLADRSGAIDEEDWGSFQFTGRETSQLEKKLKENLPKSMAISLFIRAGRHGQPTPLCINLPRSRETLHVVVFWGTAGNDRLVPVGPEASTGGASPGGSTGAPSGGGVVLADLAVGAPDLTFPDIAAAGDGAVRISVFAAQEGELAAQARIVAAREAASARHEEEVAAVQRRAEEELALRGALIV